MISFSDHKIFFKENKQDSFLIIDENIVKYYTYIIDNYNFYVVPSGEKHKNLTTVEKIIVKLISINADRKITLLGIGGGVVCDITGFVASIYKRGVKHIFMPTTLLAMVDASYGGKTGVNFNNIKNIIGTFKEPEKIIIDTEFLNTLPEDHYHYGFAEVVKAALIGSDDILQLLERDKLDAKDIISKALDFKQKIVVQDKYDSSIRRILNFGHSFGHAIEAEYGLMHGEAVFQGMQIAVNLSDKLSENKKMKIKSLINKYYPLKIINHPFNNLKKYLVNDKKNSDKIKLILLENIGKPYIAEFDIEELERKYNDLCFNRD